MIVGLDAKLPKALGKKRGAFLPRKPGYNNAAYVKPQITEFLYKAQNVQVVGYTQVAPHFIFLDILCGNGKYYLTSVSQGKQKLEL